MQYGFKSHAVKHEPIALQLLEQTLEFNQSINQSINQTLELGLQLRFTRLGGCKPVNNRLKIKTADYRLLSVAMRDKALRRSSDIVVGISFFSRDNTEKDRYALQLVTSIQR